MSIGDLHFRAPQAGDGLRIWKVVRGDEVLEDNSAYCYVLLCTHFAAHGIVAERDGELAGFVVAYRPPSNPQSVFVWQVGVTPAGRGQGLGKELLRRLIRLPGNRDAKYLSATVAPDNEASNQLFTAFARDEDTDIKTLEGYAAALFPPGHAAEPLLRIGPLPTRN